MLTGKQAHEEGDGEGQEAEDRHRLEDVERGHDDLPGAPAPRGERGDDEREDQRGSQRGEHAERRAQGVIGQVPGSSVTGSTTAAKRLLDPGGAAKNQHRGAASRTKAIRSAALGGDARRMREKGRTTRAGKACSCMSHLCTCLRRHRVRLRRSA